MGNENEVGGAQQREEDQGGLDGLPVGATGNVASKGSAKWFVVKLSALAPRETCVCVCACACA